MCLSLSGLCPNSSNWVQYSGSCYVFEETSKTCSHGNNICKTYGATLAVITSQNEQDWLYLRWNTEIRNILNQYLYCIGLFSTTANPHIWTWIDGSNVTFEAWGSQQPLVNNELCAMASFYDKGNWHDYPCSWSPVGFICKKG